MPIGPDLPLRRSGMQVRRQPVRRASPRVSSTQIYAVVLMFLSLMTIIALGGSPAMSARHLQVNGAQFTGEPVVAGLVGMDGAPNLFRLRTDRIAEALVKLPAVVSAKVEVRLPDTIVVTVVERRARLIWVVGERRYVVDDSGFMFGEVDSAGRPVPLPADYAPSPSSPAESTDSGSPLPSVSASASDSGSGSPDPGAAGSPTATVPPDGRPARPVAASPGQMARATAKPTAKLTPKPTVRPTPKPVATPTPEPTPTLQARPSLVPAPTSYPFDMTGAQAVHLPVVFDRRALDADLGLGDIVDFVSLDAGYRLANLTPADVGSKAAGLDVVVDDDNGFTVSSSAQGWVAQFGFYTESVRKDTVIPTQVRDLRSCLDFYGEDHVAWVRLVADIAANHINTYFTK
jgi:hypothetical protein